jgi:hypothetical protein
MHWSSSAKPKSDVEWMIYRASQTPGPGQYDPAEKKTVTGKFSTSKPKSDVEWKIYNASKIPGPGQYDLPDMMAKSGGKIPSRCSATSHVCLSCYAFTISSANRRAMSSG